MEIFSKRLKELRIAAGYTQQQMADKLCIRQQSYTRYENNAGEPNLSTVVTISKIFDVSCDYLLGVTEY
ncbi:MAG: helix-turn-helix transcriptional regulator [Clostridiales bacterium]|nr:helix-turn-helix transcriptional regulator [Clostridiales bacterium]